MRVSDYYSVPFLIKFWGEFTLYAVKHGNKRLSFILYLFENGKSIYNMSAMITLIQCPIINIKIGLETLSYQQNVVVLGYLDTALLRVDV